MIHEFASSCRQPAAPSAKIRSLMGDAKATDGDTLVVETTNFDRRGIATEREPEDRRALPGVAPDMVEHNTLDDPQTWTRP
jgi:hypothetical protein